MATVKVTKSAEELLQTLKKEQPELDESEIVERALSEFQRQLELQRRREWADSLPVLEISAEEARSLAEARKEEGKTMTLEELREELKET